MLGKKAFVCGRIFEALHLRHVTAAENTFDIDCAGPAFIKTAFLASMFFIIAKDLETRLRTFEASHRLTALEPSPVLTIVE